MNGFKKTRFLMGAAATGLALVAGFVLWAQVSASSHSVSVGSATAAPGESATVDVSADVPDGLGAWTMDITYDPAVVTATDCQEEAGSVCNPNFADDAVRVTGASASGVDEDTVLATITFDCANAEDVSDLTISIDVLADATIGDPQPIDGDVTINNGSVTCEDAPPVAGLGAETGPQCTNNTDDDGDGYVNDGCPAVGSPETGAECSNSTDDDSDGAVNDGCPAVVNPAPTALPPTGAFDSTSGGSDLGWVLAALAMAAVAAVAGLGALRMRNNQ